MSMIDYFKDMLSEGEAILSDPFEDAMARSLLSKDLSEERKEALIRYWNNRIALHFGDEDALQIRMLKRRAHRILRRR